MSRIIKFAKGVRNHWKKSLFAVGAASYGVSYAKNKYEINQLMRAYCEEASRYGDVTQNSLTPPRKLLVILNPAANKRSSEKTFGKYCDPILQLAGILVEVVKTEAEGYARKYVEEMNQLPDAILVAGGDGTLSEAITGLLRRTTQDKCPIGVLPLGRTNTVANKVYRIPFGANDVEEVKGLADSAISVIRGKTAPKDVLKIQVIDQEAGLKPIFAVGGLQWGAYRDAISFRDKYWYTGSLREYTSSLFNAFSNDLTWNCKAKLTYTLPCPGCSNCYVKENVQSLGSQRWWSRFIPRFKLGQQRVQPAIDYSKVVNENCSKEIIIDINPTEVLLTTDQDENQVPEVKIELSQKIDSGFEFISESWTRIRTNEGSNKEQIAARTIEIQPEKISTDDKEVFYSIDSEPYEVRPIRIYLMPKAIQMYTL